MYATFSIEKDSYQAKTARKTKKIETRMGKGPIFVRGDDWWRRVERGLRREGKLTLC